jgi:predicted NBD/HSP70 family sugar kinase
MHQGRPIRAKSGTNQEGASAHNRRVIIDALRVNGALSRADLARATALTKQTISNLIEALEVDGLVASEDVVRKGRGQPSTPYRLVADGALSIGLQIDRFVARLVAVDLVGTILDRSEAELPPDDPAMGVSVIVDLISRLRAQLGARLPDAERRIVGLGVAMPGPFGVEPAYDNPWMMPSWQSFPLVTHLSRGTGLEVQLKNDAAACATAERMIGAAHGLDDFVCIYLGYGIGAGLILGGEIYGGAHGNAGEMGMVLVGTPEQNPTPLEHRASLATLYRSVGIDPGIPEQFEMVERLVADGDKRIAAWVERAASDLRLAVHMAESLFDPQTVILSSSAPASLVRLLLERIVPLLPSSARTVNRTRPRLMLGMTHPWAVAIGAAFEPIRRAFDPSFSAILKQPERV